MQPTLPGIRFVTETGRLDRKLPRMDVAGFVGFAAAGPVNVPVAVEDVLQLEDVFGPDLALAWDPGAGRPLIAHLSPSAAHFFRQGGRRCWITRVAGGDALLHVFALPGLLAFRPESSRPALTALARARSPGAWPEGWLASTRLSREVMLPSRAGFRWELRGGSLRITGEGAEAFLPGDALRFALSAESPPSPALECYLALGGEAGPEGELPVSAFAMVEPEREWPAGFAPTAVAWVDRDGRPLDLPVAAWEPFSAEVDFAALEARGLRGWSPPPGTVVAFSGGGRTLLAQVDSVQALEDAGSPPDGLVRLGLRRLWWLVDASGLEGRQGEVPYLERLTLEITVREPGRDRAWSLSGLGLSRGETAWSALPTDDRLFPPPDEPTDTRVPEGLRGLYGRARTPRFPLAGPALASPLYLPLGMDEDEPRFRVPPLGRWDATRAIEREGLAGFRPDMLLDLDLLGDSREASVGLLEAKATQMRYLGGATVPASTRGRPLRGIHSLYFLDEVTLLAAPDAAQPGWDFVFTGQNQDVPHLDAPEITAVEGDGLARVVAWTGVAGALRWEAQAAGNGDFLRPLAESLLPAAPDPTAPARTEILLPAACPRLVYFRVRALGEDGRPGAWSATLVRRAPEPAFSRRDFALPVAPRLEFDAASLQFSWSAPSGETSFRVEEDARPDLPGPLILYCGEDRILTLEPRPEWRYARVRGEGPVPGP